MEDAQRSQKSWQRRRFSGIDGVDDIFGGFFSESFQRFQVAFFQIVNIGRVLDKAVVQKRVNYFRSQPFYVHRLFGSKIMQRSTMLYGTIFVGASYNRTVFL